MLTRNSILLIPASLTIKGQGETIKFNLTYRNHNLKAYRDKLAAEGNTVGDTVLFLVDSWDAEYPLTMEGIVEAEDDRPGLAQAIIDGWYAARRVEREKN